MSEEEDFDTSDLLNRMENNNNDRYLNEEDDDNDEYDDDEDEDEDELLIIQENNENGDDGKPFRYQNPLCKPVFKAGGLEIGFSQAKLFGLLDENGNIVLKKTNGNNGTAVPSRSVMRNRIDNMSKPREINNEIIEDPEESWKPSKSKEAQNAMKNTRCGYDFIERLNDRGDFLDRVNITNNGISKAAKAQAEADYDAKIDKLACPSCKKVQSFTEFFENKHECSQCKERFIKLKTFNASSFEERMREAAAKREAKLAAIEEATYSAPVFKAKIPPGGLSEKKEEKEKEIVEKKVIPRKEVSKPQKKNIDRENNKININRKKLEESPKLLEALPQNTQPPIDLLKKLAAIQHEQSTLLRETLQLAEEKNKISKDKIQKKDIEVKKDNNSTQKSKFDALLDPANF